MHSHSRFKPTVIQSYRKQKTRTGQFQLKQDRLLVRQAGGSIEPTEEPDRVGSLGRTSFYTFACD
jgi:hypothetical protein